MRRKFTQEEDDFIRENYLTMPMCEISRKLGRSKSCARQRAPKIGCIVPAEVGELFQKQSRIKKGHVSVNKGKKQSDYMTAEAIEKTAATRFKKGNIPHNTMHDGVIMLRSYKKNGHEEYYYIRVALGKWVPLHRHLWEKANGKILKGMKLAFRDGNTSNCKIENLELVTDAEMMRRNTLHANYPKDLCQLIQLNGAMKRKINNKIKKSENSK